jgi:hypothetical protein
VIDSSDVVLSNANMSIEIFRCWFRVLLDLLNIGINVSPDLLFDLLEFCL